MLQKAIKNSVKLRTFNIYLAVALLLAAGVIAAVPKVFASTMTQASVLESNMNSSGTSKLYVDFKAGAADGAGTFTITYPAGFTINATQTVATATCTTLFSGASALPSGSTLSAAGSGQVITVSNVSALTSGSQYCVDLTSTSAVTNHATPGNYEVDLADGTDIAHTGIDVISNDQINVDATVPPTFTLGFGANVDHLGTLAAGSVSSSTGVALTVSTNAANGWGLWAMDTNAGLHSTAASKTIASVSTGSPHTFTSGSEQYGLGVTTGNATTNYADSGSTGSGLSSSAFNEIASATGPGSSVGVTVKELAAISGVTPAAPDYSDTITIIGAGSF